MPFTPYAGTDGRVKALAVTPDLTVPVPSTAGTTAAIASITKWKAGIQAESGDPIHTFESPSTAGGGLWGNQIQGSVLSWSADIEGYFDSQATTGTLALFIPGNFILCDLFHSKGSSLGHRSAAGKIADFQFGPGVKDGPQTFTAKISGHGAFPAATLS